MPDELLQRISDPQIKAKLMTLSENKRTAFYEAVFDRHVASQFKGKLSDLQLASVRSKWVNMQQGIPSPPLDLEGKEEEPGILDKASAFGAGAYAKATGMVKTLADWDKKLQEKMGDIKITPKKGAYVGLPYDIQHVSHKSGVVDQIVSGVRDQAAKEEAQAWGLAYAMSPTAAKYGALAGDVAMSTGPFKGGGALGGTLGGVLGVKNKALMGALRGAGAFGMAEPLYSTKGTDILKSAAIGAVAGPVIDPVIEKTQAGLGKILGYGKDKFAKRAASKVAAPSAAAPTAGPTAPSGTGTTWWSELSQEEKDAALKKGAKSAEAKTGARGRPKKPEPQLDLNFKPEAPENKAWREAQYKKLGAVGLAPTKGSYQYNQVRLGKSAEDIMDALTKPKTDPGGVARSVVAQQENPQVAQALKGVQDVTRVPEGEHGTGRVAQLAKKAEAEDARRKKLAAAQPSVKIGYEGAGEESKGTPVPIAKNEIPLIDLESGLKGLKLGDMTGDKIYKLATSSSNYRKADDVGKRAMLEATYQAIGSKLGIEGAEDMEIDELYTRLLSQSKGVAVQ